MKPIGVKVNDIILWDRGDSKIEMYFKGMCNRSDEGQVNFDVRVRPVKLGQGDYTATVGGSDVVWEAPKAIPNCPNCNGERELSGYGGYICFFCGMETKAEGTRQ